MTSSTTSSDKLHRHSHLRWVPVSQMKVSSEAQREPNPRWMRTIAENFDPERFGYPVLSHRDGAFFIMDGANRIGALRLMGWDDQQVQCEVYEGLSEQDEADLFLHRNDRLTVNPMDRFLVSLTAGREEELSIRRTVMSQGLTVGRGKDSIRAVQALYVVHRAGGDVVLGRTLRLLRDCFGAEALDAPLIRGFGKLCQRYNGQLDDTEVVKVLGRMPRGHIALMQRASALRHDTGVPLDTALAVAAVQVINAHRRGGNKLPQWRSGVVTDEVKPPRRRTEGT